LQITSAPVATLSLPIRIDGRRDKCMGSMATVNVGCDEWRYAIYNISLSEQVKQKEENWNRGVS